MVHTNDLYYRDGLHSTRVHAIRPIDPINFHPMTHEYLAMTNIAKNSVQVYVQTVGGLSWITVYKHQLGIMRIPPC